jgi:predicted dinucleotide-binding enzyme
MKIGIIGSGTLGSNIARALAKKGLSATIANKEGPASMANLIKELGSTIKAGIIEEAASADIVILAVPWVALEKLLAGLPAWNNRIVIDATNPVLFLDPNSPDAKDPTNPLAVFGIKAVDLGGKYSSSIVRILVSGARLVKTFNHLDAKVLSEPEVLGGKRTLFFTGDDASAKAEVRKLLEAIGYFPLDLGVLDVGGPLMELPFGALAMSNFIKI